MTFKSEILAVIFGMLVIFIVFGDAAQIYWVGNLDTIFGQGAAGWMDVLYPLGTIIVFLLYGLSKGGIKVSLSRVLLFLALLAAILIMQFDDIFVVLKRPITLPGVYWNTARILYLIIAPGVFIAFGWLCTKSQKTKRR